MSSSRRRSSATTARRPRATVKDGDSVIFFNYRGDRPREITKAFVYDTFPYVDKKKDGKPPSTASGFDRGRKLNLYYVTMTAYEKGLPVARRLSQAAEDEQHPRRVPRQARASSSSAAPRPRSSRT